MTVNWLDVLIMLILIGGMFLGFWQGAVRQLLTLGALYAAIVISSQVYPFLAQKILEVSPRMVTTVADVVAFFALMFILGLVLTFLLIDLLRQITRRPVGMLGRVLGGTVGILIAAIFISVSLAAIAFMTLTIWPQSSEAFRQEIISARLRSNLVLAFRQIIPLILQAIRIWGGNLPPLFSVDPGGPS